MNLQDLSTQLLYTTVPIWTEGAGGKSSAATAFFYNVPVNDNPGQSIPLIVTNYHVVSDAIRVVIEVVEREGDAPKSDHRLLVDVPSTLWSKHSNPQLDLAAAPIGSLLNAREAIGKPVFFRSIDPSLVPSASAKEDLAAMEDIVFIGYPSGLRDEKNATPLVRRGITSTPVWNDFKGEPCFLIDAGVFPGSSGSPVFILNQGAYATKQGLVVGNRILFLGVVTETLLRPSSGEVYLGLGKVVRSDVVAKFLGQIGEALAKQVATAA